MGNEVEIFWTASWSCPECGEFTDQNDPWVDDIGDHFEITCCDHKIDSGKEYFSECGYDYTVLKESKINLLY